MTAAVPPQQIGELPEKSGYLKLTRGVDGFDWRKLVRRAGPLGLPLILHILDCTDSAYGNPKSAHIPCDQFEMLTGRTSRAIRGELARLVSVGLISRDEMNPWCFTPHPEAFGKAPLLMPERRPTKAERKKRAKEAAVIAVSQLAAFRSTMASPPTQTQRTPTEIHFRLDDPAHSEIHFRPAEIDVRSAETYCPWNWTCPHLSNDIGEDKPLKPLKPEGGRAASTVLEEEPPARSPLPDALVEGLKDRRLLPDGSLLDNVRAGLGEMPVEWFLDVLDERLKRGRIGTGLLMEMVAKARAEWTPPPERTQFDEEVLRLAEQSRVERLAESSKEHAEKLARETRLKEHPEECPTCHGEGKYGPKLNRRICNCPKAWQILEGK